MKSEITFDDFTKIDLRVGTILTAEAIPKSKKLVKLSVSFGPEVGNRIILAGIAEHFTPEQLVGTRVVAVINLAPRAMMGIESHGMLLAGHGNCGLELVQCGNVHSIQDGTSIG